MRSKLITCLKTKYAAIYRDPIKEEQGGLNLKDIVPPLKNTHNTLLFFRSRLLHDSPPSYYYRGSTPLVGMIGTLARRH